ncbi:MAG: hypothetical protein WCE48_02235 [Steroidobacteraceae bacterium]
MQLTGAPLAPRPAWAVRSPIQFSEQLAAASFHGRCTPGSEWSQSPQNARPQVRRFPGKIGKRLHRERPHDAAAVVQVLTKYAQHLSPLGWTPLDSRQHLRDMPSNLLLIALRDLIDELGPEAAQIFGMARRDFLNGIGRTHSDQRVVRQHPRKDDVEQSRMGEHFRHDFIRPADGTSVAAAELIENRMHERRRSRARTWAAPVERGVRQRGLQA